MIRRCLTAALACTALAACNLAPHYRVPTSVALPGQFKAAPGWVPATPADAVAKGQWWRLFNDPLLDSLEARVEITNQNVAAARAAYVQARALVAQSRAAIFPTVSLSGSADKTGTFGNGTAIAATSIGGTAATGTSSSSSTTTSFSRSTSYSAQIGASWEPDLFGRLDNGVRQARASEQASAADLINATLAARAELATDYLQLRGVEAQSQLLDRTVVAYTRALAITRNKYDAGTVSHEDVYTAQTTLSNAMVSQRDFARQRAVLEDAVAVLAGENPSTFTIPMAVWAPTLPDVPGVVPADILQRRPDIAAAERNVAAANANIGIQRAGFFPSLGLSGSVGASAGAIGDLFTAAASLWSLGASVTQTVLDFGATSARVRQARGQYDAAVATYRQTVLTAFQQVEDNLAGTTAYAAETADATTAADAATHAETIANNQYLAGIVDFTNVTQAQTIAYQARQNLIQNTVNRQAAAVALIEAIGGEWTGGVPLDPPPPR